MTQAWRIFGGLLPVFAVLGAIGAVVTWRLARSERLETALRLWAVGAVVVVAGFALVPVAWAGADTGMNLVPFRSIAEIATNSVDVSVAVRNIAGNIVVFMPVGFAVLPVFRSRRSPIVAATLVALAVSAAVEVTQLVLPLGRVVDVDDLILNTLGGWMGALAAAVCLHVIRRRRREPL